MTQGETTGTGGGETTLRAFRFAPVVRATRTRAAPASS